MNMDDIKLFTKSEKEVETLIQTVGIYSQYIGMEFVIEKCAILEMKNEKRPTTKLIEMPNQERIKMLGKKENYKYLGILEVVNIKEAEMKEKIRKDYLKRTWRLLETKLGNRNLIQGINTLAISKILSTILKIDKEKFQSNGPENKKVDDDVQGVISVRWHR